MGTVMGAFFAKNGLQAELIDYNRAHVDALNEKGARIIGFANFETPVKAITNDKMSGTYDLIFLFAKQLANAQLLPKILPFLDGGSTVCTLQNGVPEPSVAKYIGKERTVGGAVLWSATFHGPGISELTQDISGSGHLFDIGEISGEITERIETVATILRHMGPVAVTNKLMDSRWGKLMGNACMSGMSAVCGATFGEICDNLKARACLSYLGREVKACCEAEGYKLPDIIGGYSSACLGFDNGAMFEESQKFFTDLYRPSRKAKASMLQDLEKGNQTEVLMINGYVSKCGDMHGIETPFNDKVVEIITRIENGELICSVENLELFAPEFSLIN